MSVRVAGIGIKPISQLFFFSPSIKQSLLTAYCIKWFDDQNSRCAMSKRFTVKNHFHQTAM